ncbi:MAG: hypothetical protein ABI759_23505 [Candidatus Solibacter sp.]
MKLFFAILIPVLAASAADGQAAKSTAPTTKSSTAKSSAKPAKATDASKPMAIPADAVQDATGDFHHTDAQGNKWLYRKTPFGVTRLEDAPQPVATQGRPSTAGGAGILAFDEGDKVRFEKQGPFGLWKWEKKKTELDEGEKAALQASKSNRQNTSK